MPKWIAARVAKTARMLLLLAAAAGLMIGGGCQDPGTFPRKKMQIVCPWAPGGGTDRVSRHWAEALKQKLGKPCIVVNRTGGSGATGHEAGAGARADGHTLTIITFELSTMHRMGITDLTHEDFEPLLQMNADPAAIVVHKDAPWKNVAELLAEAKANPGKLKMSGTARGGAWDLARAGLLRAAGLPVETIAWIPKKGAAPSLKDLLGKHIDAVCCSVPEADQQIASGDLRVLAVMSEKRLPDYPDIPTCKEAGIDWVVVGWRGLAAPKGTPPDVLKKLMETCQSIAESDAYRDFMKQNRFGVAVRVGEEFSKFLAAQDAQWKEVIEAAGYAKK